MKISDYFWFFRLAYIQSPILLRLVKASHALGNFNVSKNCLHTNHLFCERLSSVIMVHANNTTDASSCSTTSTFPVQVVETIFYSIVLLLGVTCNFLVIAIVYKNRSLRTPANFFIANMAFADFMVPIFLVPHIMVQIYEGDSTWIIKGSFGAFMCKLVPFVIDISLMVSIHSLVLVALERFYAVIRPMRAAIRSTRRCFIIITVTWFLAVMFHAPYLVNFKVFEKKDRDICTYSWAPLDNSKVTKRLYVAIFLLFYSFPLSTITLLYCIIIYKLKKQRIPGTRYGHMIINRQKRIVNTFRMVMTVVLAFFVCWTPEKLSTVLIIYHYNFKPPCNLMRSQIIVTALAYSNCAITPIIYFVFNENYKNGLKGLLPWYEKTQSATYPRGHSTNSSLRSAAMTTRVSFRRNSIEYIDPSALSQPGVLLRDN